jgi:hypothetical protein
MLEPNTHYWDEDAVVARCRARLASPPEYPCCLAWLDHEGPHVGVALWPNESPHYIPGPVFVRWLRDDAPAAERSYTFHAPDFPNSTEPATAGDSQGSF